MMKKKMETTTWDREFGVWGPGDLRFRLSSFGFRFRVC